MKPTPKVFASGLAHWRSTVSVFATTPWISSRVPGFPTAIRLAGEGDKTGGGSACVQRGWGIFSVIRWKGVA